jgi:hypothetical protein
LVDGNHSWSCCVNCCVSCCFSHTTAAPAVYRSAPASLLLLYLHASSQQ